MSVDEFVILQIHISPTGMVLINMKEGSIFLVEKIETADKVSKHTDFSVIQIAKRVIENRLLLLIILLAILAGFETIQYPKSFPHWDNIRAVLLDSAQGGILSAGMMCLMIAGVFDISVGATLALGGVVAGIMVKVWSLPPIIAIIGGALSGSIVGLFNGLLIAKLRLNAMLTTLATMYIVRGLTQVIAPSGMANLPEKFKPFGQTVILGLQSPFWFMLIIAVLLWFSMSKTSYFHQFYLIGANKKAARYLGVRADELLIVDFALMGLLAGFTGTLLSSRLGNAVVLAGTGAEMRAIASAILGGASLTGGVGTIPGAIIGAVFLSFIQNGLIIAHVPVFWQGVVIGTVLILAMSIDQFNKKIK